MKLLLARSLQIRLRSPRRFRKQNLVKASFALHSSPSSLHSRITYTYVPFVAELRDDKRSQQLKQPPKKKSNTQGTHVRMTFTYTAHKFVPRHRSTAAVHTHRRHTGRKFDQQSFAVRRCLRTCVFTHEPYAHRHVHTRTNTQVGHSKNILQMRTVYTLPHSVPVASRSTLHTSLRVRSSKLHLIKLSSMEKLYG